MIIFSEPTFDTHNYIIPVTAVTQALVFFTSRGMVAAEAEQQMKAIW